MAQTAILVSREDVAWKLLQITGVTIPYFVVRRFLDKYKLPLSHQEEPSQRQTLEIEPGGTGLSSLRLNPF